MLQEEEGTLAVLPLYGHVQQGLPIRHGVIDGGPRAQQLGCDRVHAWENSKPRLMVLNLSCFLHILQQHTHSQLLKASSFPLDITGFTLTEW